ncbi:hypothetical protein [Bradyrhizobium sp.]|uniref:hypothetical protein n=1 Tax=Bradyrhizobium sp. TaxID=376 RepID=UPI0039196265
MKRLILVMLVAAQTAMSQAVLAQMAPAPKPGVAKRADACAPIGRTEDGKLVYSMKCDPLPNPVTPPQAAAQPSAPAAAAEPEPETERSGLFGMSFDRRPKQ